MPDKADRERSLKGLGPVVGRTRRKLLQTGLGLAGTALALDVMATAKPASSALEAAQKLTNRGKPTTTDSQIAAKDVIQNTSQREPIHPTEIQVQTSVHVDGTLAVQGDSVPEIGDFSPQIGLHWFEQHWQDVLIVGIPVGTGATIAKIVHARLTGNKALASSFQHALTLLESTELESQAAAAVEFLFLLDNPRSEQYHQRIFTMAVDHFRQRTVESGDQRDTITDFKFVPVLVFAAPAIRDRLQRKGANLADVRDKYLNASHIHMDGLLLREADLSCLILKEATFSGAVLSFADFSFADLAGADLRHATLNNTNLSHAVLTGAKLNGARARDANLSHALLRNTDLENTDLSYANLEATELWDDANVKGANIYRATGLTVEMRNRFLEMGAIEQDSLHI